MYAPGIDVGASLREFEAALAAGTDPDQCWTILTILWRWQRDPDLSVVSRRTAEELLSRFGARYLR